MGQRALAPRSTSICTAALVTSVLRVQISDWSMWLCPLRHHWPGAMPRALKARREPSGDSAAKYSFV
jgi:hypothetical protein